MLPRLRPPLPEPPGRASTTYRCAGGLAITSLVLAGGIALVNVLMALTSVLMQNRDRDDSLVFAIIGYGLLAAVMLALLLAAFIVKFLWLMQCRKFADAYRPGDEHRHGNTWVWLGWWVPWPAPRADLHSFASPSWEAAGCLHGRRPHPH